MHLKGALLTEGVDEDGQQGGVQLLRIVQRHHAPGAALQEPRQLLLHRAGRVRAGMRRLPRLSSTWMLVILPCIGVSLQECCLTHPLDLFDTAH